MKSLFAFTMSLAATFVGLSGNGCNGSDQRMVTLKDPILRADKVVLELGSTYFEVDPAHGARVTALVVAGTEMLSSKAINATNFGSTFWPSPQASWNAAHWPPPAAIDNLAYASAVAGARVTLTSAVDRDTNLRVSKTFTPNLADEAVEIEYVMSNEGTAAASFAPWEITRVAATGITFWPTGGVPFQGPQALLASVDAAGHTWVDAASLPAVEAKLFADGAGGWLAHVHGDIILIKQFEDQPATAAAPGEAEIEVYLDPTHSYVEVEPQGPYASIAPGDHATWKVKWYARKLPTGVVARVGSTDLIAFVTQTLK